MTRTTTLIELVVLLLSAIGCGHTDPLPDAAELRETTRGFDIYWPPEDPEGTMPPSARPLLKGALVLAAEPQPGGGSAVRLSIALTRPSSEADREFWNSELAFPDLAWMSKVRVWDAESEWLWPNLPNLLRLPGKERVERYGGVDPGKHVDNDFAAVLIRKYGARGAVESADTKDNPLVSAEWHAVGVADADAHSLVHGAKSDEFVLHLGGESGPA